MNEIIVYSCLLILLPLVPAYILYASLPAQEGDDFVEGEYQGLNIKLKGAFSGYFILVLLLSGFIGARLYTEPEYDFWTIEGTIDTNVISNPKLVHYSIEPPVRQKYQNGKFIIENIPIKKGMIGRSTLVAIETSTGVVREHVISLVDKKQVWESENNHEIKFNNGVITIGSDIDFRSTQTIENLSDYSPQNSHAPIPKSNTRG